VRSWVFT